MYIQTIHIEKSVNEERSTHTRAEVQRLLCRHPYLYNKSETKKQTNNEQTNKRTNKLTN